MAKITITVNGRRVSEDVSASTLLVDFVRDTLGLTGTPVGRDTSQCGAYVLHVDGESLKSCTRLALQCNGSDVTTIEGLARNGELHPVQSAFRDAHALQCGFCTPGMIMSAVDRLETNPKPTETEIKTWLKGNICRCTGRQNIVSAIQIASGQTPSEGNPEATA